MIESVKTAGEILMPATGTMIEANATLADEPGKVNEDPLGEGWFFKFKANDAGELAGFMDEAGYNAYLDTLRLTRTAATFRQGLRAWRATPINSV